MIVACPLYLCSHIHTLYFGFGGGKYDMFLITLKRGCRQKVITSFEHAVRNKADDQGRVNNNAHAYILHTD